MWIGVRAADPKVRHFFILKVYGSAGSFIELEDCTRVTRWILQCLRTNVPDGSSANAGTDNRNVTRLHQPLCRRLDGSEPEAKGYRLTAALGVISSERIPVTLRDRVIRHTLYFNDPATGRESRDRRSDLCAQVA